MIDRHYTSYADVQPLVELIVHANMKFHAATAASPPLATIERRLTMAKSKSPAPKAKKKPAKPTK